MWRGLSLTMPLKVAAFEVAESVTDTARRAGAINTLVRTDSGWAADNTDVHGVTAALAEAGVADLESATVIGSGATARSAVLGLVALGARQVTVAARTPERAAALADVADIELQVVPLQEWASTGDRAVVSTVPAGAANAGAGEHAGRDLTGTVLLDVVYADWPTPSAAPRPRTGRTWSRAWRCSSTRRRASSSSSPVSRHRWRRCRPRVGRRWGRAVTPRTRDGLARAGWEDARHVALVDCW
ncbi:NAD(P)-binding domain-containing protein [Janibacter hoylei]|nr:NAD(P)-binding domain-containing protein [Janibacter hoylei]MCW4600628.1 NAD(P)-binding domain-containing protein [Janibacter hoylei]